MPKQKLKVALLCNNKMAIPAMMRLQNVGVLCAVATADTDVEAISMVKASCGDVPFSVIGFRNNKQQVLDWLKTYQPDIVFVITFPYRISAEAMNTPRLGFVNFHFGLLPEMRGADPIFESIRHRLPMAGSTVHVMDEGLDTGPIILREEVPITPDYTYGMLSAQMAMLGEKQCGELLLRLRKMPDTQPGERAKISAAEFFNATAQDETKAKYWQKVGEEDITIRWDKMTADEVVALVRAGNPISKGAPTSINGWKIGVQDICHVNLDGDASAIAPGTIIAIDHQNGL